MQRQFKTLYRATRVTKHSCATTLKGAIRAAIIRIALREYDQATIFFEDQPIALIKISGRGRTELTVARKELL